jgi:hypothetical protein
MGSVCGNFWLNLSPAWQKSLGQGSGASDTIGDNK